MRRRLFFSALVAALVSAFVASARAEIADGRLFLWVELIGFDNAADDYGVGAYLDRMTRKPDMVSLLLDNDRLFMFYRGFDATAKLLPDNCAYGGRPYNVERRRQDWTEGQLKGLVAELQKHGIEVFASFFHWYPEVMPKSDADAERVATQLVKFLADFGFNGFHGSDGYAPPRFLLPECPDGERAKVARARAERYAANWRTFVTALKAKGLKSWINTCWTLDPFEALYRYGVDYRLLAKTGIDGFIVESSATSLQVQGCTSPGFSPLDKSAAMLLRLKAAVPDVPMVLLHAINDGNEQWSALRHAPAMTKSEAIALGTLFYGKRRILDGFLACLADGITREEWKELEKGWRLPFLDVKEPLGTRIVWSDRAFDREFEDCVVSHDASSFTLLRNLLAHRAPVCTIVSVEEALADKSYPIVLLNPEFFPPEELAALRDRRVRVFELGRGARARCEVKYVPRADDSPFPGMPSNDTCYFTKPLSENLPADDFFRHEAEAIMELMPFLVGGYGFSASKMHCWGLQLANGRTAVFVRNDDDVYGNALVRVQKCISDVLVHSDFPSKPVQTCLSGCVAPHDTMVISFGDHEWPLPDPNVDCGKMK